MISEKQIKQVEKIFGAGAFCYYAYGDNVEWAIIGDFDLARKSFIEQSLEWNQEVIDFVNKTTPEERKEIARIARIHALEKELEKLKSEIN